MRLSKILRLCVQRSVVFTFSLSSFFVSVYYLYAFPTSLAASASQYFYQIAPFDPSIAHLQERAFALGGIRPVCPVRSWHEQRYAGLANASTVFLAINFYNNQDVLPTFFQELPTVLRHLGHDRVFVSIYENGSTDRTVEMLGILQELLSTLGVLHSIVTDQSQNSRLPGHRIEILSGVRNKVLSPLYDGTAVKFFPENHFDELLFMNDISFCAADVFELLYEKRVQGANQACTVDWMESVIYDRWVLRDIRGKPFYRWEDVNFFYSWLPYPFAAGLSPPLPEAPEERVRFEKSLPLQVFSCWNGAAVFDADAFTGADGIRFRMSQADLDTTGTPAAATDKASECFLSSVDMWKHGRGKIMIVPKASVSYDARHYRVHRKDHVVPPARDRERIEWKHTPPAQVAMQDYSFWNGPERWTTWDEQR